MWYEPQAAAAVPAPLRPHSEEIKINNETFIFVDLDTVICVQRIDILPVSRNRTMPRQFVCLSVCQYKRNAHSVVSGRMAQRANGEERRQIVNIRCARIFLLRFHAHFPFIISNSKSKTYRFS